jgi:beta-galactosidase
MKKRLAVICCGAILFFSASAQKQSNPTTDFAQRTILFDKDWLFIKDSVIDASTAFFNDQSWRKVELPHDWSIEDLEPQLPGKTAGPFDTASIGKTSTGFVVGGTGWYRKHFRLHPSSKGKQVTLSFDGVYMVSDVWLNGHHLGTHPYGYTPFYYDLTNWLKPAGEENVLAVKVENKGRNSRWYSGSGIYRHVWLQTKAPLHIAQWGVAVTTPEVSMAKATIRVETTIENSGEAKFPFRIRTIIKAPNGVTVASVETSEGTITGNEALQTIQITSPQLWSVERPTLYQAVTQVVQKGQVVDQQTTPFGIRSISMTAANGFLLNGKKVLLKGGCIHHDNGPLGSATIDRAEERKIEVLKKNGFNAIRTSHNPPSQQLLEACDRLGMLVIDEAFDMWERPKNPQDYHQYFKEWWQKDLASMVLRDRNHPSVILWSIGNEINERADTSGFRIAKNLVDLVHQLDNSRPVTEAICSFWEPENKGKTWQSTVPSFALLDVGGYNYMWREYIADHQKFPQRIMVGTESLPKEALENWNLVEKNPYVIGDFVWTAVDYTGETAIGHTILSNRKDSFSFGWPWYNAWCGDIDIIGYKKPQMYYRDVVWRNSPVELAVHRPVPDGLQEIVSMWGWPDELKSWTWPGQEGKSMQVRVFSRAPMVRLELNGKVVEEKQIADTSITAVFDIPYQPGTLKAIALEKNTVVGTTAVQTVTGTKHLRLTADRNRIRTDRNDLAYVTVEVVDAAGNIDPTAEVPVHFSVAGSGGLLAVGSADPVDMSSFRLPVKKTFRGRCLAIVRPFEKAGVIKVKVWADGVKETELAITVR